MSNPVTEFLNFEKQAGGLGEFGAQVGIATGVAVGAKVIEDVYHHLSTALNRSRDFKRMIEFNPELQKEDRTKVQAIFNTLHNASPSLARDPLVANSWVKRMMYQDEYIDPRTLSDLAATEQRMAQPHIGLGLQDVSRQVSSGMQSWRNQQEQLAQRQRHHEEQQDFSAGVESSKQENWKTEQKQRTAQEAERQRQWGEEQKFKEREVPYHQWHQSEQQRNWDAQQAHWRAQQADWNRTGNSSSND